MSTKGNIPLTTLAERLEKAIHCDVGMQGLRILLYGWMQKRARHGLRTINFAARGSYSGETYLTPNEGYEFSNYAGYDLTHD